VGGVGLVSMDRSFQVGMLIKSRKPLHARKIKLIICIDGPPKNGYTQIQSIDVSDQPRQSAAAVQHSWIYCPDWEEA